MSASSEYEPVVHKDYGPATSSQNVFDHALDPKVADMIPARQHILRTARDQPDSTNADHSQRIHADKKNADTATDEVVGETDQHARNLLPSLTSVAAPPAMWLPGVLAAPDRRDELSHMIISEPYEQQPRSNSKVQIISNIALTKAPAYSTYDRHMYKLSAAMPAGPSVISGPVKNATYVHTVSKGTTRVNNGADLAAILTTAPAQSAARSGQNHKTSRRAGGRGSRSGNNATPQKTQARPVKMIQQTPASRSWGARTGEAAHVIQRVGSPQYAPNLRYAPAYGDAAQMTANQQLTAQILQSLSQPTALSPAHALTKPVTPTPPALSDAVESQFGHTRRIIFGDSSTPSTTDDIHGVEERPNLPQELLRYSFQTLAFVMLDHTYALKLPPAPPPAAPAPPAAPVPPPCPSPAPPARCPSPPPPAPAPPVHAVPVPPVAPAAADDDDGSSSSTSGRSRGGSDTETAPEGEDEGRTRCICDFTHDDGYMICCDRCGEWQHVDCMGVDRANIPDSYLCGTCRPRGLDRKRARALQLRKRLELFGPDHERRPTVTTYHVTAPRRRKPTRRRRQPAACEPALTNHYSPELRARLHKLRLGSPPVPNPPDHITASVPHAGGHILVATAELAPHTPVIELRGKYMLWGQRKTAARPTAFVFRYRLRDDTTVCVDARTYGNQARYVRRSCRPNAALQHYISKGALHVFIVTSGPVQADTEITVGHEPGGKHPCACGQPTRCRRDLAAARDKRPRARHVPPRRVSVIKREPDAVEADHYEEPVKTKLEPIIKNDIPKDEVITHIKEEIKEEVHKPEHIHVIETKIEEKVVVKEQKLMDENKILEEIEVKQETIKIDEPEKVIAQKEIKTIKEKVVHEKEEPAAIKEELVIKEEIITNEPNLETNVFSDEEKSKTEIVREESDRVTRTSVSARSACADRSSRSSRNLSANHDSMDEKTDDSQDKVLTSTKEKDKKKMTREERKMEAILKAFERMERAEQKKQEVKERQKRRESDPAQSAADKDDDDDIACNKKRKKRKGRARTTSQGGCRRRDDSGDSEHEAETTHTQDLGLSPACLLVEAAVGSVESTFKLPKTKKTMANEWIGQSPDRTPSPYRSPYRPALVNASSLESLVHVASTIIGDLSSERETSPPRRDKSKPPKKSRKVPRISPPAEVREIEVPPSPITAHSAKKRWLRQAISEESDSPTAESPPNEMITPLKKRRVARESLSLEPSSLLMNNEESSPRLNFEDSPVKSDGRVPLARSCKLRNFSDSLYCGRSRSESGHASDDQLLLDASNDVLNANITGPHDSENIRRIIGIPTPDEMEQLHRLAKPDDGNAANSINNNVGENDAANAYDGKVEPMDIDTTTPQNKMIHAEHNTTSVIVRAGSPDKLESASADTSGNSSPRLNEMDDIQKKIHSFHTENIMILQSRNKKPPKEKRKKVNLNFDLNMVDDQISIQLRTDKFECNGDVQGKLHYISTENIPLPGDSYRWPNPENIPLPEQTGVPAEAIPLPDDGVVVIRSGSNSPELLLKDGKTSEDSVENIPLPSDIYRWPNPENIPLPEESAVLPETIPLPDEGVVVIRSGSNSPEPIQKDEKVGEEIAEISETLKTKETSAPIISPTPDAIEVISATSSTKPTCHTVQPLEKLESESYSRGLFSGIFNNMNQKSDAQINENIPNMQIIKNAIDHSAFLDKSLFDKETISPDDELKNVREILSRVNNMQSSNSAILSGVLRNADVGNVADAGRSPARPRPADPRLNPPPQEKPKPVRRKLSISEYRKRHKGSTDEVVTTAPAAPDPDPDHGLSPEDLEARLQQSLANSQPPNVLEGRASARREKLSTRLRREFGLAVPDDETHDPSSSSSAAAR